MADSSRNQAPYVSCRSQSLSMDHLEPSSLAPWDRGLQQEVNFEYLETRCDVHTLTTDQQHQSKYQQHGMSIGTNETKPRLGKDENEILEREFRRNPKPTTKTKRQHAEDMNVDLSRINNWFQNRRAKQKQNEKQFAYNEQQTQEASGQHLEPSSPDFFSSNQYFSGDPKSSTSVGSSNIVPHVVSAFSPQILDTSITSTEPLQRTISMALACASTSSYLNSTIEPIRREPLNLSGGISHLFGAYMELKYTDTNSPVPSLTAGSSLNSTPNQSPQVNGHFTAIAPVMVAGYGSIESHQTGPHSSQSPVQQTRKFTFSNTTLKDFSDNEFPSSSSIIAMDTPVQQTRKFAFSNTTLKDFSDNESPLSSSSMTMDTEEHEQRSSITQSLIPPPISTREQPENEHALDFIQAEIGHEDENTSQGEELSGDESCDFDESEGSGSYCDNRMKSGDIIPCALHDRQEEEPSHLVSNILDSMRESLVERIMGEFWLFFDQNWATLATQCPGECSPPPGDTNGGYNGDHPPGNGAQSRPKFISSKRHRVCDEESADESGDEKSPKQQRRGPLPATGFDLARFACPYRKYYPEKYSIRSHRVCALTSWDTIARVKEHLYRKHKAAPYCKRCWRVFKTQELKDSHTTVPANLICEAVPGEPPEGVTTKQMAALRSRAKPYSKQSEVERWNEMFRLLFPGANIPSPYWEPVQEQVVLSPDSQALMRYDDYIHRELPSLVRSRVEEVVRRETRPIEATIFASLEGLVRECQAQLSSTYRETHLIEQEGSSIPAPMASSDALTRDKSVEFIPTTVEEKDQDPPTEFFDSVLQPPPVQEDDYVVDFSVSDTALFASYTASLNNSSDSGYVSVSRCTCKEECTCLASKTEIGDWSIDAGDPFFAAFAQNLEAQANEDQWQG